MTVDEHSVLFTCGDRCCNPLYVEYTRLTYDVNLQQITSGDRESNFIDQVSVVSSTIEGGAGGGREGRWTKLNDPKITLESQEHRKWGFTPGMESPDTPRECHCSTHVYTPTHTYTYILTQGERQRGGEEYNK